MSGAEIGMQAHRLIVLGVVCYFAGAAIVAAILYGAKQGREQIKRERNRGNWK